MELRGRQELVTIDTLCVDVLLKIFSYLEPKEIAEIALVCKSWALSLKSSGQLYEYLRIDFSRCPPPLLDNDPCKRSAYVLEKNLEQACSWAGLRLGFTLDLDIRLHRLASQYSQRILVHVFKPGLISGKLRRLHLSTEGILVMPSGMKELKSLETLHLEGRESHTPIETWLDPFPNLTDLTLAIKLRNMYEGGVYRSFPAGISVALPCLSQLQKLTIDEGKMQQIVYDSNRSPNYQTLEVFHSGPGKGPALMPFTRNSENFRKMVLRHCRLNNLPIELEISHAIGLRTLDLACNDLVRLPTSLSRLGKLQELDLSGNRFNFVPPLRIPSLTYLNLSCNTNLQLDASDPFLVCERMGPRLLQKCKFQGYKADKYNYGLYEVVQCDLQSLKVLQLWTVDRNPWSHQSQLEIDKLKGLSRLKVNKPLKDRTHRFFKGCPSCSISRRFDCSKEF